MVFDTTEEPDKSAQKIKTEQINTNKNFNMIRCIEYNQKGFCCQEKNFSYYKLVIPMDLSFGSKNNRAQQFRLLLSE
jgi:hypothetical protein